MSVKIDFFRGKIRARIIGSEQSHASEYDHNGCLLKGRIILNHALIRSFVRNGYQPIVVDPTQARLRYRGTIGALA